MVLIIKEQIHKPIPVKAVYHPFSALIAGGIFILTIGIMSSGILKFSFFPAVDDLAIATIEYASGTLIEAIREA